MSTEKKDEIKIAVTPVVIGATKLAITTSLLESGLKIMSDLFDDINEPKEKEKDDKN
jgi:hypothetical protein